MGEICKIEFGASNEWQGPRKYTEFLDPKLVWSLLWLAGVQEFRGRRSLRFAVSTDDDLQSWIAYNKRQSRRQIHVRTTVCQTVSTWVNDTQYCMLFSLLYLECYNCTHSTRARRLIASRVCIYYRLSYVRPGKTRRRSRP